MTSIVKMSDAGGYLNSLPRYTSMLAGNAAFMPSAYESIATFTGNGSASQITFSSIPSTYSHLQIRVLTRGVRSFGTEQLYLRFNGDATSGNYRYHYVYGDGSSALAGASGADTVVLLGEIPAANEAANVHASAVVDILDYANTSKTTVTRSLFGYDNNANTGVATAKIWFGSGLWTSTAAITSVTVLSNGAFTSASTFALYGIKGA